MKTTMALNEETIKSALSSTIIIDPNAKPKQQGQQGKMAPASSRTSAEAANNIRFSFDRSFQEKIVQAMIMDRTWASQITEVLQVDFFEYAYLKKISSSYMEYYEKYKEFPSIDLLATIVASDLKNAADEAIRSQVKDFLVRVSQHENLGDLGYVKEKSLDFCKRVGLQKALNSPLTSSKRKSTKRWLRPSKRPLLLVPSTRLALI